MHTREQAFALLQSYNQTDSLIKHALAVEGVMRYFAQLNGEDVAYWGMVGLLHDLDYERFPEEHCMQSEKILREAGYGEDFIHAVMSHGYGMCTDVKPIHRMEQILYTIDELTGLITATAYMRPSHSVMDLETKSVKKKFKSPSFASGVNRDVILNGCDMLQMPLDEIIEKTILGMRACAEQIGLKGEI